MKSSLAAYMLIVADVIELRRRVMSHAERSLFGIDKLSVRRSEIPAMIHVDHSARVQTLHRETNPRYHVLLTRFKALIGCPVLVNTSSTCAASRCMHARRGVPLLHGQ